MTQEELLATEITLKLSVETINVALSALSNLPYKDANGTIQAITNQAQAQINAIEAKEEAESADVEAVEAVTEDVSATE